MKLREKLLTLCMVLTLTVGATYSPKSEAILLASMSPEGRDLKPGPIGMFFMCIVILPLCFLDEGQISSSTVDREYLIENGYTDEEIEKIFTDQAKVATKLKEKNLKLEIRDGETAGDIHNQLRSIEPTLSHEYLQFVTDYRGL